jgi:hypothetical protein
MWIVEVRGSELMPTGGQTPNERYGVDIWGPALFAGGNKTELSDQDASTFGIEESARVLTATLSLLITNLEFRTREL